MSKSPLRELQSWITAYEKLNGSPPNLNIIKAKIKELLKSETVEKTSKLNKIYFRDCIWSDYKVLRDELIKDETFVKQYVGVDLQAYIDSALVWSEKGNTTTENGWKLTLKNWMRDAKRNGKLIMKPIVEKKSETFINH